MAQASELLGRMAGAVSQNKYLSIIKDAFVDYMPFTIVGAVGTLWTFVIVDTTSGLASLIPAVAGLSFLNPLFNALNFACMGCIALGITFAVGYHTGKANGQNPAYTGLMALAALMIVTNYNVDASTVAITLADGTMATVADILPEGAIANSVAAIASGNLGSTGMFTGLIVGIVSVELLGALEKIDALKIRMPDAVPPNIAGSFNSLIPTGIALIIVGGVAFALQSVTGVFLNDLIFSIVQVPLQNVGGSFVGGLVFSLVISLFWCFGLHGNNMVGAVQTPLLTALLLENEAAVRAGQMPTNIVNGSFWACFMSICGTGIALAITISIFLVGRREENRTIAKISLAPNLFNINETIVFGLPIVLNPPMCVGFVLAPVASYLIAYGLTAIGVCPVMYINVPWTTPIVLSGFLASGGNIMGAVTQLICLAAAVLVYIPCVRAYEAEA